MITYEWLYILAGSFFAIWALLSLRDRLWGNAGFWGLLAASFFGGSHFSDLENGILVLAMVAIAGLGGLKRSNPDTTGETSRQKRALSLGNKLFIPALIEPFTAVAGTWERLLAVRRAALSRKDPSSLPSSSSRWVWRFSR